MPGEAVNEAPFHPTREKRREARCFAPTLFLGGASVEMQKRVMTTEKRKERFIDAYGGGRFNRNLPENTSIIKGSKPQRHPEEEEIRKEK